jgi:PelA/Pel-15E family pectate lyase
MFLRWLLVFGLVSCGTQAATVGTNTPARSLTMERIAKLPADKQQPWKDYLLRSERQMRADQAVLANEMVSLHLAKPILPPHGRGASGIPLRESAAWYGQDEAKHDADGIVSFQTPAGGWSKNLNMTQHTRAPGEHFAPDNLNRFPDPADFDKPANTNWDYVGTFDNDATITQLRFLAKVIAARGLDQSAEYRASFLRGLDYIFAAQYPDGGWPQVWPLQGGYHDAITYNDDAMLNIIELLEATAAATNEFMFVPKEFCERAKISVRRGVSCILATQVIANGHLTAWGQQHDPLTLESESGRNYEMPSLCAAESSRLMIFLMRQPQPDAETVMAVHSAALWFQKTALHDVAVRFAGNSGRELVSSPGAGPLWARYYQIGSDRPIFGDRDKTIHDDLREISRERRIGYNWYNAEPKAALDMYADWSKEHPRQYVVFSR